MRTLVTLLGLSPGTVTGMYYALHERNPAETPERIVVVTTEAPETAACLDMIREKFRNPATEESDSPHLEIEVAKGVGDLVDSPSTEKFQAKIAAVLRRERDRVGNEVWLSIAGGRKSMAALGALAAQIIGVDHMVHLYVIPELEQYGDINQLLLDSSWQARCLHPDKEDYTLVDVPFFALAVEKGQLELLLKGQPDDFVHEIVRAQPDILTQLPEDAVHAYWAYVSAKVPAPQYEDLTIHIRPSPGVADEYQVSAYGDGVADAHSILSSMFSLRDIETFIDLSRQSRLEPAARAEIQSLGRKLYQSLFTDDILEALWYKKAWAKKDGRGVRLRLRIAPDAKLGPYPLARLPWELLCDREQFLGLQRQFSIVRHVETLQPAGIIPVEDHLRVLIAAANPKNKPLPEDVELDALYAGVHDFALRLVLARLDDPPRTFANLERTLDAIQPHVFYFTGHGTAGGLVFENPDRTQDIHSAREVGALLAGRNVRLVVLNACYGAQAGRTDMQSVAEALIAAGIPAVVAMQSAVLTGRREDAPAVCFAKEFFYHLAAGWPVDTCVMAARIKIKEVLSKSFQWALPVCFLRSGDGKLFAFQET